MVVKTVAMLALICASALGFSQSASSGPSNTSARASCGAVANTGSNNKITIVCENMSADQAQKLANVFNGILAIEKNIDDAIARLNQALRNANPNNQSENWNCEGTKHEIKNSPELGGGDMTVQFTTERFRQLVDTLNAGKNAEALSLCTPLLSSEPAWLTPELVCAIAQYQSGNRAEAVRLTKDFDLRTGDAYTVSLCGSMSKFLHDQLAVDLAK